MQIWNFRHANMDFSKHHIFKYDFREKTQYSNMNFWCFLVTPARAPPSWSKPAKRLIFYTLKESHFRDHLQVTGHREKFYIVFFAQIFFGGQYTCGEARKKFWHKKSMKNFSRSTHTWWVPESHPLFLFFHFLSFGLFWARNYDLNFLKKKVIQI